MSTQTADFPVREPMTTTGGLIADRWRVWLRNLRQDVNLRTNRLAAIVYDTQSASIGLTAFETDTLTEGQYRVGAFTHVTTPASLNSSLIVTLSFTHKTIACTLPSTALTTNLTTSVQSNEWFVSIDGGSPISYSTTYVSNIAGMIYSIALTLEQVNA